MKKFLGLSVFLALAIIGGTLVNAQFQLIDPSLIEPVYYYDPAIYDPALVEPAPTQETTTTTDPRTSTTDTGTTDPTGTTTGTMVPADGTTTETVGTTEPTQQTGSSDTPVLIETTTIGTPGILVLPDDPRFPPGRTQETEETQLVCPTQEVLQCPANTGTPGGGAGINQLNAGWIVFGGAGIGALIWALSLYLMNGSQARREKLRFDRSLRMKGQEEKHLQLEKAYPGLSNSLASLITDAQAGKNLNPKEIDSYKKNGVALELFGSEESREAHKNFMTALNKGSQKDVSAAGKQLLNTLKKDLGFSDSSK